MFFCMKDCVVKGKFMEEMDSFPGNSFFPVWKYC